MSGEVILNRNLCKLERSYTGRSSLEHYGAYGNIFIVRRWKALTTISHEMDWMRFMHGVAGIALRSRRAYK